MTETGSFEDALGTAFFVVLAHRDGLATQEDVNAAMAELAAAKARRAAE